MARVAKNSRFRRAWGTFEGKNAVYKDMQTGVLSGKLSSPGELQAWIESRLAGDGGSQLELPLDNSVVPAAAQPASGDSSDGDAPIKLALSGGNFPVLGRDLHEALRADTKYATWIARRLEESGAVLGFDYEERTGGSGFLEHAFTMDMAKHLAMMAKSEVGQKVRRYFIDCEKALVGATAVSFNDPLEAARLYIEAETARREAEAKLLTTTTEVRTLGDQVDLLTAKVEAPRTCVTLTRFAKDTESVLGMTPPILFQYLRDTGVIGRAPASKWDSSNVILAPYNGCGYFQYARHSFDRPARNEAGDVESMASITKTTPMLTPDKYRDGARVRLGGFSWLLAKIQKDPRAALYRLVARDGGREGRWAPLYGARIFEARSCDGLICDTDPAIITFWKNPSKDASGDKFVVCRYTAAPGQTGFLKANGPTLTAALEALLAATPDGARKPLAKVHIFDE